MKPLAVELMLDSSGAGGIETHVLSLAKALKNNGMAVKVVLMRAVLTHPLVDALAVESVPIVTLDGSISAVLRHVRQSKPSILHTHGYRAGILGRLAGKLSGVPVVSTFHNGDLGQGKLRFYTLLDQLTAGFSTNIAVSSAIAMRIANAVMIPNFIRLPKPEQIALHRPCVAFVGRFSHEKGPDLFVELARRLPGLSFAMYGDGPMRAELEATAPDNIRFYGMVQSMEQHWKDVGLLCITSRAEGLPYAALEAMANGVPLASFPLGELPQIINSPSIGWLCRDFNLDEMQCAVEQWATQEPAGVNRLSKRVYERIAADYSEQSILPKIVSQYLNAIH